VRSGAFLVPGSESLPSGETKYSVADNTPANAGAAKKTINGILKSPFKMFGMGACHRLLSVPISARTAALILPDVLPFLAVLDRKDGLVHILARFLCCFDPQVGYPGFLGMSKLITRTAVCVALAIVAALLLTAWGAANTRAATLEKVGANPMEQRLNPVDLTPFYDKDPSFDGPGCWQAVPRGLQTIANVPFNIAGIIQLWGQGPAGIGRNYRERVEGIPVAGMFQTLYILHGSSFTTRAGTPIAQVVFRYSDGSSLTNSILYGIDSRDWWEPLAEHDPLPTNSASKIVWRCDHPSLPDWVKSLRLFGTGLANPKPESEVKTVDLFSTKSPTAWVVLAITSGPRDVLKVDSRAELAVETEAEETTLKLSALDKDTGQPIRKIRFRVTLVSGRRPKPYGIFAADEQGEASIDLPPVRIKLLSIETISSDYESEQMIWNIEKGEKLPASYVFKVSK
jgi:hypothetical protein